jgi:hypothetical protein
MDAKVSFLGTMSRRIMDAKAKTGPSYLIKLKSPILKSAKLSVLLFIYLVGNISIKIVRFLFISLFPFIYHVGNISIKIVRFLFISLFLFIYHVGKIAIEMVGFYLSLLLIEMPLFLIKMLKRK